MTQNKRLVKKKQAVTKSPMHYTANNLSKAANTVGQWVLTGLGKAGQAFNELLTSGASTDFGQTSPFVMSSVKERRAIQKGKLKALKKANEKIMQGMTWVSPLNYGVALATGNGLDAKKGEEEVASWSPAWQAVGRVGELYLGPKIVKGIKSAPKARAAVIARKINKGIGTYTYEPIIPEKRISYLPKLLLEPSTSLAFFERNHPFKGKQLTEHVQGDEAVKMFKEYGGEPIPEGSINGELLRKYVTEARERYGIMDNKNITDEEIAQALYKHSKELGGNTAAVNALGEPLLLFRGDTKAYTELRNNHHESGGTEDNVLGTLFLDRTGIGEGWGPDRYLYLSNKNRLVMAPYRTGIESESFSLLKPKFKDGYLHDGFDKGYIVDEQISYPYWNYTKKSGETIQGNKIASDNFADGTVNHLNAFVVRTPSVRDITNEVVVTGGKPGTPPPFNWLISKENRIGHNLHDVRLALNKAVVEEAKKHNQGLLKSDRGSYWRGEEHENYDYFALPDFNVQGAKHLLPYDLRIPRNWKDKNIYRGLIPLAGGYTLYDLFNQPLQQLQYLKQGGKIL